MRPEVGGRWGVWRRAVFDCWKLWAAALGVIAGLLVLFAWDPAHSTGYPPCPFHALTGLHCPGCGTLRALHQLLHGNLPAAFLLNPLTVLCLPWIVYELLSGLVRAVSGRRWPPVFRSALSIRILLGAIVLFWVLRNVPLAPFAWMAP
jgi:hypothetical protein